MALCGRVGASKMKANDAGVVREEIGRYLIEASAWRPSDKDKWRARLTITRKGEGVGAPLSQTFRDISAVFEDAGDACRCAYERGKKLINEGPPNLKI
jgi:hypothetical protein